MPSDQKASPPESPERFENLPVDPAVLPRAGEVAFIGLQQNYLYVRLIGSLFTSAFLFLGVAMLLTFTGNWFDVYWLSISFGAWFLITILSLVFAWFGFRVKGYALRQRDVMYKSGLIWRRWITVPFNRVQHCEVKKGPIEDFFSLASLRVFTAGGSGSDLDIPGLTEEKAQEMRQYILSKSTAADEEE